MFVRTAIVVVSVFGFVCGSFAQEMPNSKLIESKAGGAKPVELAALKASVGEWDAEIEVWSNGPDAPSMKFKGVEINRAYGEYWIASDFDSEIMGQTMKVHSIVGYDPDQKIMVGTVIDHGIYSARMTGDYVKESKVFRWKTEARDVNGNPLLQRTTITQKSDNERVLVLMVPGKTGVGFTKFMQIQYKRKK